MSPFDLASKKILVTGASSGIGRQVAIQISEIGGTVFLNGRNATALKKTASQLNGLGHVVIPADLINEEEMDKLVKELPEINGVVHCAGIVEASPVKYISKQQMEGMLQINYMAPVLLTGKLLRMKKVAKAASIVFMSSVSSDFPHKGGAIYAGTKSALNAYCKVVALEYAVRKIRANYINAAMVKTPLFQEVEAKVGKEAMDAHGSKYPLGFGEVEDVANTVLFLLSDASRWITGTGIVMDGGLTTGE